MKILPMVLILVIGFTNEARSQSEEPTGRMLVGVLVGGYDYYFGEWPLYPLASARIQQRFFDVVAVEVGLTGVAAGEAVICVETRQCPRRHQFKRLLYPSVGIQLSIPMDPLMPFAGVSAGELIGDQGWNSASSTSYEFGARWRVGATRYLVVEARHRSDDLFRIVETRSTEFTLGMYWQVSSGN